MSMTKLKVGIISAVVVAGISIPLVMRQRAQTQLHEANEALRRQAAETSRLAGENEQLSKRVALANPPAPVSNNSSLEMLKLRGEVGRLRRENADTAASKTNGPSILSGIAANPEMMKMIRAQNKAALQMAYKDFARKAKLTTEQTDQLSDLLADNAVGCIEPITEILRDGKSPEEVNKLFDARDAAFLEKVLALLGPEGFAQYQAYTHNLVSAGTAEQFKGKLTGDTGEQDAKSKQLYQLMLEETQSALAAAGLGADFQTAPMLNFRNIASETEAEKNLKLLDSIYERVAGRAGSFLSAEELKKFAEFRTAAITQNRMALAVNRKMMAPGPH